MSLEGSVVPLDGPQPAISSAAASGYTISRYEILDLGLPLSVKRLIIHGLVLSLGVIIIGHFRLKGSTRPIITVVHADPTRLSGRHSLILGVCIYG